MNGYQLSDNERKIRKTWLILTLVIYLGVPFLALGFLLLEFLLTGTGIDYRIFTIITLTATFWSLILYYNVYKKYGTGLLTFLLVFAPLQKLLSLFKELRSVEDLFYNPIFYLSLLEAGIFIYWYILSLKLRKINKEIQLHPIRNSQNYMTAISILKDASTLEQLNALYSDLLREKDNGNFTQKEAIFEAYNKTKKTLLA